MGQSTWGHRSSKQLEESPSKETIFQTVHLNNLSILNFKMKIFFALALVIYFPCSVVLGSGAYQAYPYMQCYTNTAKYSGDRPDNPIFGSGGFVGEMTGEECKAMCDDETNVDEYDRRCVAYEHSSQNPSDVANCALAWACDSAKEWEGGATYTTEFDCTVLPLSMNGHDSGYGCPGAIWTDGSASQRYCMGTDMDDNVDAYPWWKTCCEWKDGACVAL